MSGTLGDSVSGTLIIIVEPARRRNGTAIAGTYFASLEGEGQPLVASRTPFLAAARVLRDRGVSPDTRLVMRWRGTDADSLASPLGAAAALTVDEGPPMRFVRYVQLPMRLRK
jgi:hypothetical protein